MARLLNRQSASSHAHLALRISAGGLGSERAYLELEARFGWLRRRVAHRALTQTAAEAIVCEALADTILGPPHVEAAWTNALFAGHMRRRANKIANLAVAQREGLPLDFVAMRSFLRRVIDRLEGLLGCPPSVTAVLADPAVIARRKPVPPSYVEWLLDERGGRFVRLDTSERTLDDLLGAMDESLCIEQPYPDHALALASRYDHIRLFVELVLREEGYTFEEIAQLVRRPEPPALHDTRTGEALSWHAVAAEWPGRGNRPACPPPRTSCAARHPDRRSPLVARSGRRVARYPVGLGKGANPIPQTRWDVCGRSSHTQGAPHRPWQSRPFGARRGFFTPPRPNVPPSSPIRTAILR